MDTDTRIPPCCASRSTWPCISTLPRTRHSYYRQLRLIHEQSGCDPSAMTEEMLRDYFLHVKTVKRWKPKTIRQADAAAKLFFVGILEHEEWRIFSHILCQKLAR